MIRYCQLPRKKEIPFVETVINSLVDDYRDFYITKNNIRLFVKDNFDVVLKDLRRGDRIAYCEEGVGLIVGFADKSPRKYVKVLAKDLHTADKILTVLIDWNNKNLELFAKVKKNNPIIEVLKKHKFKFLVNRGREVLFKRSIGA